MASVDQGGGDRSAKPAGRARRRLVLSRNRATLIWAAGFFIVSQLICKCVIEYAKPECRDSLFETKVSVLESRLSRAKEVDPYTIVMVGSSRTEWGLDGSQMEAQLDSALGRPTVVYNLGRAGGGPLTQLIYVRRLLRRGIRPSMLLVEVTPTMLSNVNPARDAMRWPGHLLEFGDLPTLRAFGGTAWPKVYGEWLESIAAPVYSHRQTIASGYLQKSLPLKSRVLWWADLNSSGWSPSAAADPADREFVALNRQLYVENMKNIVYGGLAYDALAEILNVTRKEGIISVLVLMPEGPQLRNLYPDGSWESFVSLIEKLSAETRVPVVNCREWLSEEKFFDSHHMLASGAKVFSRLLAAEIVMLEQRRVESRIIAKSGGPE